MEQDCLEFFAPLMTVKLFRSDSSNVELDVDFDEYTKKSVESQFFGTDTSSDTLRNLSKLLGKQIFIVLFCFY